MTDPTPKPSALLLAEEILGGIQYGDSRDDPEWRKEVIASAARLIDREMTKAVDEVFVELLGYTRGEMHLWLMFQRGRILGCGCDAETVCPKHPIRMQTEA